MTRGLQKTLAWSGIAQLALLFPGAVMAGLIPPIAPTKTAEQIAEFWSMDTGLKQCGLAIMLAAAAFQIPFGALIATRIRAMEGRFSPLAYMEVMCAVFAVVALVIPVFAFAATSFRPERDPQITQALNDLGWISFVMIWPPPTAQCLVIGFAIFGHHGRREVWPRWLAYYNFWTGFIMVAGGAVILFKTGVFAWNGVVAFWLVVTAFGVWCIVMTWQLLVTIPKDHVLHERDLDEAVPLI